MNVQDMADLFRIMAAQCRGRNLEILFDTDGDILVGLPTEASIETTPERLAWMVMNGGPVPKRHCTPPPSSLGAQTLSAPGYDDLADVLARAFHQAAHGKGAERHADSRPFSQQPMQELIRLYGVGFALGQAGKKMQEAARLPAGADVRELLGAIVYIAGAIISLERARAASNDNAPGHQGVNRA